MAPREEDEEEAASLLPSNQADGGHGDPNTKRIRKRPTAPSFSLRACRGKTPGAVLSASMKRNQQEEEEEHRRNVAQWLADGSGGAPPAVSTPAHRNVRPGRIFRALEGQPCMGVTGTFMFTIGVGPNERSWVMTCPEPEEGSEEQPTIFTMEIVTRSVGGQSPAKARESRTMSMTYHAPDQGVHAHIYYDSEKTWLRSFSGHTSDMKLMVLGKLKIGGDMTTALKLEPIFKMAGDVLQSMPPSEDDGDEVDPLALEEGDEDEEDEYEVDKQVISTLNDARRMVYQLLVWQDISWGMYVVRPPLPMPSSKPDTDANQLELSCKQSSHNRLTAHRSHPKGTLCFTRTSSNNG